MFLLYVLEHPGALRKREKVISLSFQFLSTEDGDRCWKDRVLAFEEQTCLGVGEEAWRSSLIDLEARILFLAL